VRRKSHCGGRNSVYRLPKVITCLSAQRDKTYMAYKIAVKRRNGEFIFSPVMREPTPIFGSKVPMMLDGRWVHVQLVGLALRVSDGGELIDHLEGNEL